VIWGESFFYDALTTYAKINGPKVSTLILTFTRYIFYRYLVFENVAFASISTLQSPSIIAGTKAYHPSPGKPATKLQSLRSCIKTSTLYFSIHLYPLASSSLGEKARTSYHSSMLHHSWALLSQGGLPHFSVIILFLASYCPCSIKRFLPLCIDSPMDFQHVR